MTALEPVMAYPFGGYGVKDVFAPKDLHNVYMTAIRNILLTEKGTLPFNPTFGSNIQKFVFDLNDIVNQQLVLYYAFKDIQEQEPRLRVVGFDASFDVDKYKMNFTVAFVEFDDPSQIVRTAKIDNIPLKKA